MSFKINNSLKLEDTQTVQTTTRPPSWLLSEVIFHAKKSLLLDCQIWWRYLKQRPIYYKQFRPWTL